MYSEPKTSNKSAGTTSPDKRVVIVQGQDWKTTLRTGRLYFLVSGDGLGRGRGRGQQLAQLPVGTCRHCGK